MIKVQNVDRSYTRKSRKEISAEDSFHVEVHCITSSFPCKLGCRNFPANPSVDPCIKTYQQTQVNAYREDMQINTMLLNTTRANSSLLAVAIFGYYQYKYSDGISSLTCCTTKIHCISIYSKLFQEQRKIQGKKKHSLDDCGTRIKSDPFQPPAVMTKCCHEYLWSHNDLLLIMEWT